MADLIAQLAPGAYDVTDISLGTTQTYTVPVIASGTIVGSQEFSVQGGNPGTLTTFQWQSSPDDLTWTDIAGAEGATYTAPAGSEGTYYRRRMISQNQGEVVTPSVEFIVFTPATLFAVGDAGVVYDVSDLSSMNTSPLNDGTTPVVGDAVRFIADKSGNGNNATTPSVAASPILRQDANSKYYLEFDGVDDEFVTQSNVDVSGNSAREYVGAFGPGGAAATLNINGLDGERWTVRDDAGNWRLEIQGSGYTSALSADGVVGARLPGGGTLGDHVLSNGTTDENASGTNAVNTSIGPLYIGRTKDVSWGATDFYGFTLIGKLLTTQQRSDARQYYAEKRGVVL